MTPQEFRDIRLGLMLTQQQLANILGYRHKIRISEFERTANPVPVPEHIARAMLWFARTGLRPRSKAVREWTPPAVDEGVPDFMR